MGSIEDVRAYRESERDVRDYVGTLAGAEQDVMSLYYLRGMTTVEIGLRLNYDERQIRRIRQRVLSRLEDV